MDSWGRPVARARAGAVLALALSFMLAFAWRMARAGEPSPAPAAPYEREVRELALAAAAPRAGAARIDVQVGALDPRLRLAPCERVEPYLPPGTRLWGRTRIGLRCTRGPSPWNVYLPVTVKVFAPALVAARPLPAGAVIGEADLRTSEVDLAADPTPALADAARAMGRTLGRALNAGQSLREGDLRARRWFAAGETVTVVARGTGFSVAGEAQALTPGTEGEPARVRTAGGRVLTGVPVGERRVELAP